MEAGKRLPFKRCTVGLLSAFLWDGVCVGVCVGGGIKWATCLHRNVKSPHKEILPKKKKTKHHHHTHKCY